jgi:hypothetical protein
MPTPRTRFWLSADPMGDVPVVRRFVQCLVVVGAQVRLGVEDDCLVPARAGPVFGKNCVERVF